MGCPSRVGGGIGGHQFDGITTSATQTPSSPSGMHRPFNGCRFGSDTCNRTQIFCRCKWPPGSAPAWKRTLNTGESLGIVFRTRCADISRWRFDCCWRSSSACVAFCDVVTVAELSVAVSEISGTINRAGTVCFVENGPYMARIETGWVVCTTVNLSTDKTVSCEDFMDVLDEGWFDVTSLTPFCLGECLRKNPLSGDSKCTSTASFGTVSNVRPVKM